MKINHTISMKIKNARESQGFSQRDLSVKAGLSASYIGAVEARRINPSINALNKIAAALHVDPSYLIEKEPGVLADQFKDHLSLKEKEFIAKQKNRPWITLASELADEGVTPEEIKDLMKTVFKVRRNRKVSKE